jgi:hypothetical protein
MRKNKLNYLVDAIALVLMMGMVATGLVVRYVLPPGSSGRGGGRGYVLWGYNRHAWGDVHFWLSIFLIVMLAVHLFLHWAWIYGSTQRVVVGCERPIPPTRRRKAVMGVAFSAAIVGLIGSFFWLASGNVRPAQAGVTAPTPAPVETQPAVHVDELIHGSMTLRDAALAVGMMPEDLRSALHLPVDVSLDERLGRLRRQYGFELDEVRAILREQGGRPRAEHSQ